MSGHLRNASFLLFVSIALGGVMQTSLTAFTYLDSNDIQKTLAALEGRQREVEATIRGANLAREAQTSGGVTRYGTGVGREAAGAGIRR